MSNKQFKAESKRLLDLMINSIYTNKEIFLRELISNASDAMDKLYYRSLTDKNLKINKEDLKIKIDIDKEKRTLTITDNGCGMTEDELDKNLGTIAKSGSLAFKEQNDKKEDINIIGQFGVGFYSAFMVSDEVKVESKSIDSEQAYCWTSKGVEGYTIEPCDKKEVGTKITLHIKEDSEEEKYSEFLEEYKIQWIIKRYSDYISYPIQMDVEHEKTKEGSKETEKVIETETINSMIPLWKKDKNFWISYDGIVTLGIDSSKLDVKVDGENVKIHIPEAKVLSSKPNPDSITKDSYYYAKNSAIADADDQTKAYKKAEKEMEKTAANDTVLLAQAQQRVQSMLEDYVKNMGTMLGKEYTITWDIKENHVKPDTAESTE